MGVPKVVSAFGLSRVRISGVRAIVLFQLGPKVSGRLKKGPHLRGSAFRGSESHSNFPPRKGKKITTTNTKELSGQRLVPSTSKAGSGQTGCYF